MDRSAVIGALMRDRTKESLKALKPLYLVNTCWNHLSVNGKNLYPQVGNREPIGTQRYMRMTKMATAEQNTVSGILTLLSSMSILPLEALPVRVAAVFFSSTYFWTANIASVIASRTTAIAAAPALSYAPVIWR